MSRPQEVRPFVIAALMGALLWLGAALVSGKREAWDGSAYWAGAYPLSLLACAYLGYTHPDRPWRWALVLFEAQFVAMCLRNGELGNLWPLGMALFAVIAVPGVIVARFASKYGAGSQGNAA